MANYFALTAPRVDNALVDFSPLSNALNDYAQGKRLQRQDAIAADERQYNRTRNAQQDAIAAENRTYERSIADRNYKEQVMQRLGTAASKLHLLPTEQQLPFWEKLKAEHHRIFGTDGLTKEDDDFTTGPMRMAAHAGVIDDPLPRQLVQSQIAENNANAKKYEASAANGGSDFGKTVLNGYDANGNPVPMVIKGDKLIPAQTPDGITFDPTKAALEKKKADLKAEAQAALPDIEEQAGFMRGQVDKIRNDPALKNVTGWLDNWVPTALRGEASRAVQSRIDNIDAQQYMLAFQKMRGAGAISNQEGTAASKAISRIKDQGLSDTEYQNALDELKMVIHNGVIKAQVKAGKLPESALSQLYPFDDDGNPMGLGSNGKQVGSLNSELPEITIRQVR